MPEAAREGAGAGDLPQPQDAPGPRDLLEPQDTPGPQDLLEPQDTPGPRDLPELLELDRRHVWHPYGPMPGRQEPLLVASASGVRLRLADGRELVDAMASWWSAIHGYNHPVLNEAARRQLDRMSHVMFGGLTHEPAVRLSKRLVDITPEGLEHVFLADSGSVSVEVALKMCLQYWRSLGRPAKHRLLTWRGGYHGDTWQPMSVCDPDGGMHALWSGVLPRQIFADPPPAEYDERYAEQLHDLVARHAGELAAVIVEPVVQGAGGMRFHSPRYLRTLREACDRHDVLLVFDEIATGFGRTGTLFAAEQAGVTPDVMCVGKALTGGYLTMAATLCTARVADGIARGEVPVLAHGPTFMGNPLAAAVADASVSLLLAQDWAAEVRRIERGLRAGLGPAAALPGVRDVRVLGAIGVVQLERPLDERGMAAATRAAVDAGVWIRPFGDLLYTMPPYVTGDEDVARICRAVCAAAEAAGAEGPQGRPPVAHGAGAVADGRPAEVLRPGRPRGAGEGVER
ncbi:adenosylmethionine-8-amino-7-oxononanoate aminotransferase [Streptomyces sp. TS71-3]|nr:adenosylmethionine-8-amino-7-oxononanoate aminotransferase [Streptomyces sp. TS71-3]